MIEGVKLYPLKRISVPKGDILHALKSSDEGFCGFGEAYFTHIKAGETKGWKRHNRLTLNLFVPYGKVKFVIYDDREDSTTKGHFQEVVLSPDENYQRLTVAPGLWLAFHGESDVTSIVMDIIPEPHDDAEGSRKPLEDLPYEF